MLSHKRPIGKFVAWVSDHTPDIPEADLGKMLFESIIEGLDAIDRGMSTTVLYHVSRIEGLKEEEIAVNVDGFDEGLERIFGEGSSALDSLILKRFKSKLAEYLVGTDTAYKDKGAQP